LASSIIANAQAARDQFERGHENEAFLRLEDIEKVIGVLKDVKSRCSPPVGSVPFSALSVALFFLRPVLHQPINIAPVKDSTNEAFGHKPDHTVLGSDASYFATACRATFVAKIRHQGELEIWLVFFLGFPTITCQECRPPMRLIPLLAKQRKPTNQPTNQPVSLT
jgi:hypothetical protein